MGLGGRGCQRVTGCQCYSSLAAPCVCVYGCSLCTALHCSTLYWTDWNREAPKIESSSWDGQKRRVIVSDGIGLPNALTYDHSTDQVCWADAGKHHLIWCFLFAQFSFSLYKIHLISAKAHCCHTRKKTHGSVFAF